MSSSLSHTLRCHPGVSNYVTNRLQYAVSALHEVTVRSQILHALVIRMALLDSETLLPLPKVTKMIHSKEYEGPDEDKLISGAIKYIKSLKSKLRGYYRKYD